MIKAAPSKEAIVRYLNKEPDAWKEVLKTFANRSILIALGIGILGNPKHIIKNSISASLAIELYLLWYYSKQLDNVE